MSAEQKPSSSRTIIVTGATSGIGLAIARRRAASGDTVIAMGRNTDQLNRLHREFKDRISPIQLDISDEASVIAAFAQAGRDHGRIDAFAACAGIADATPLEEIDAALFARIMAVNAGGTFLCIREAIKLFGEKGRICTVSSVAGLRGGGVFGTAAYAASKGAIIALTKTVARDLAKRGITVNCVVPGSTHTPMLDQFWDSEEQRERIRSMIPVGRPGTPDEVASAIEWVISEEAGFMTGSTMVVDGGLCMW